MAASSELVSVIIPAYNGERTIEATLQSVRSQSHEHLEILVVDDGSTDGTQDIVASYARADRRVRLIRQANGGVAAARNRGVAEAAGDLVAPVDADDLWRAGKIEQQLDALHEAGADTALVYTLFSVIDENGVVTSNRSNPTYAGDVLRGICRGNFVGNGSSPLMRKAAVVEAGGYDSSLRARKAQGLEDHLLYYRIATRHRFARVGERLVGYRQTPDNMSSDVLQMWRSWLIVSQEMLAQQPQYATEIRDGGLDLRRWLLGRVVAAKRWDDAMYLAGDIVRTSPGYAVGELARSARSRLRRMKAAAATGSGGPLPFLTS